MNTTSPNGDDQPEPPRKKMALVGILLFLIALGLSASIYWKVYHYGP
ncbi:MAG: hypothetical protein HQL82_10135 [Magnetococcales bacterium]|nr:hypothetical protein [Magnetococcales bacterium]